ncbi:hypothetical protein N8940_01940 [Sphingomonadaceae bacterium]|nr:hypothetical protein [Sphingomonadaceae bacterium]
MDRMLHSSGEKSSQHSNGTDLRDGEGDEDGAYVMDRTLPNEAAVGKRGQPALTMDAGKEASVGCP